MHGHIEKYFERFCNVLGPGNRRYIQTLMVLTRAFLQVFLKEDTGYGDSCHDTGKASGANGAPTSSTAINDFLFSLNIDNINLVKLLQYIKESNIMHKVKPSSEYIFFIWLYSSLLFRCSISYNVIGYPGKWVWR